MSRAANSQPWVVCLRQTAHFFLLSSKIFQAWTKIQAIETTKYISWSVVCITPWREISRESCIQASIPLARDDRQPSFYRPDLQKSSHSRWFPQKYCKCFPALCQGREKTIPLTFYKNHSIIKVWKPDGCHNMIQQVLLRVTSSQPWAICCSRRLTFLSASFCKNDRMITKITEQWQFLRRYKNLSKSLAFVTRWCYDSRQRK